MESIRGRIHPVVATPGVFTLHAVYLQTNQQGVLVSTDLGTSWLAYDAEANQWADDLAVAPPLTTTGVDAPLLGVSSVLVAGFGADDLVSVSQQGRHLPVPASEGAGDGNLTRTHAALFRCTATLACREKVFGFPADFAKNRTIYVTLQAASARRPLQAWISTDAGAHFTRWRAVDAVLAPANAQGGQTVAAGLATTAGSATMYLHVTAKRVFPSRSAPVPPQQVFRSDDRGARWTRVAWGDRQRGNLGFHLPHGLDWRRTGDVWLLPDGRVFAPGGIYHGVAGTSEYGLWCSVDRGRTWARHCAR